MSAVAIPVQSSVPLATEIICSEPAGSCGITPSFRSSFRSFSIASDTNDPSGVSAILPDGTGDVLGLWFRANEGTTVRAKGFDDPRNRGVQDILIAAVDVEAAEAAPVEVEDPDLAAK